LRAFGDGLGIEVVVGNELCSGECRMTCGRLLMTVLWVFGFPSSEETFLFEERVDELTH
jgi:hypothetical protein